MPRKLPWEVGRSSNSKQAILKPQPRKRTRIGQDENDGASDGSAPPSAGSSRLAAARSPSSSPPPAPPSQEFMNEGLNGDDIWIMVEDEFQETASLFTRHLHAAEYKRLKHLAKVQNASTINEIARPSISTSGSNESRIKSNAPILSAKQKSVLRSLDGSGESEDEPWSQDTHLAALMSRPKESVRRLATIASVSSKTRAAAGFKEAQSKNQDGLNSESRRQIGGVDSSSDLRTHNRGEQTIVSNPNYQAEKSSETLQKRSSYGQTLRDDVARLGGHPQHSKHISSQRYKVPAVTSGSAQLDTGKANLTNKAMAKPKFMLLDDFDDFPRRRSQKSVPTGSSRNEEDRDSRVRPSARSPNAPRLKTLEELDDLTKRKAAPSVMAKNHEESDAKKIEKSKKPISIDEIPTFL